MKKIQTFFHRRKRTMAFFLAGAIAAASFVPKLVSAYNLDDGWYSSPQAECTWGDNSLAMQNKPAKYVPTGLAFNSAVYTFNPALLPPETASKLNINEYWGLGAQNFLVMRPGYENSEFAMFDGRHTYCAGTHEVAAGIQPGAQAFAADENGFSLPNKPYAAAHKGSNPDFNFLMLVLACCYPGDYKVPADAAYSYQDPWAAQGMVSQLITWLATDADKPGFQGVPKDADQAAVDAGFTQDLAYFWNSVYYKTCLPNALAIDPDGRLKEELYSTNVPAEAAERGLTTMLDVHFWYIWSAAYYTSILQPDWEKGITKANAPVEQKDGEYHVYLDLFMNDSAKLYMSGISYQPFGDWEYLGIDEGTGKHHFKSASGEVDENSSIGKFFWPKGTLGACLPLDVTKAKVFTFDTYNANANPPAFNRTQTQFAAWAAADLEVYVTIGEDEPDPGDFKGECERFEHTEVFLASYNVNLLKYDSETGKPLADSHWDVLEKFDDTQLDNTDLDREAGSPGSYESGLGSLNSTEWGDDEISSNYSGKRRDAAAQDRKKTRIRKKRRKNPKTCLNPAA